MHLTAKWNSHNREHEQTVVNVNSFDVWSNMFRTDWIKTEWGLKQIRVERNNWHRATYICCVSEDDALAVVVTNGLGGHGDCDKWPVDF